MDLITGMHAVRLLQQAKSCVACCVTLITKPCKGHKACCVSSHLIIELEDRAATAAETQSCEAISKACAALRYLCKHM